MDRKTIVIILVIIASFFIGRAMGIKHAIEDSELWAYEVYNPSSPEESAWNEYDMRVIIELDGEVYEHGMNIG